MDFCEEIKTVIIDDNTEFLNSLEEHLAVFPEIKIVGKANQYKEAKKLLLTTAPDLVFLDIEMPCKNGFELLNEVREVGRGQFSVIFYTSYDKYMINALRESAFDFLIKPIHPRELKNVIERIKKKRSSAQPVILQDLNNIPYFSETVAVPSLTGLQFIHKNKIVLIQSSKESILEKHTWEILLSNFEQIKLKKNTTSKEILHLMGNGSFVQVNQSCILNIHYLGGVEFKSRECLLVPPFAHLKLTVSRTQMTELRDRFDLL
jgi:two-component system LytT family response regulator